MLWLPLPPATHYPDQTAGYRLHAAEVCGNTRGEAALHAILYSITLTGHHSYTDACACNWIRLLVAGPFSGLCRQPMSTFKAAKAAVKQLRLKLERAVRNASDRPAIYHFVRLRCTRSTVSASALYAGSDGPSFGDCLPGSGCPALHGDHRICYAVIGLAAMRLCSDQVACCQSPMPIPAPSAMAGCCTTELHQSQDR